MNDFFQQTRCVFRNLYGLDDNPEPNEHLPPEWFELAQRNRIAGLWVEHAGSSRCGDAWSRYAYGKIRYSSRLADEACRIVTALNRTVPSIRIVKGPVLAAQAWPNPSLRTFDDLDFRCDKGSLNSLVEGLGRLGYTPREEDSIRRKNLWHFGWGISFISPDGIIAEFNHRMFPPHYLWPENLTQDISGSWVLQELEGGALLCPSPALHLLLCSVHAVWHGWERLGWLVDVAGLLVRYPDVFPEAERLVCGCRFARQALYSTLAVVHHIFGPLPGLMYEPEGFLDLVEKAVNVLENPCADVQQYRCDLHWRLMTTPEKLSYTVCRFLIPGDPDFMRWSFSGNQRLLYWPLRPVRKVLGFF